jgi:sigma-B regulation protein RsbU (phosphoserine phosphatase)
VLGFIDPVDFEEDSIALSPDDLLVIYSDGVTDAVDDRDAPFGDERLSNVILEGRADTAAALIDRIVAAVRDHAGDRPQADDMTLVVVKREGP